MLASYQSGGESSTPSRFVLPIPPIENRNVIEEQIVDPAPQSDSPQFVLKNVNGEFKLVLARADDQNDEKNPIAKNNKIQCINLLSDNENQTIQMNENKNKNNNKNKNRNYKKRKYIDLCSSDGHLNDYNTNNKRKKRRKSECISLVTSDSCDDGNNNYNDNINTNNRNKKTVNKEEEIEFHPFLNKPMMNDASDSIYQFFKMIINKYKNDKNILSKIEIEGRIGMLLKKEPPKNKKIRNNRYLRVADDIFASSKNKKGISDTIYVFKTKRTGCKFESDVKKQTFYYFQKVMNGLYTNSNILNKNEKLNINKNESYPSMTYKSIKKITKKYDHNVRDIEFITDKVEINNKRERGQKERIGNLDICFNFDESDYDLRINASIERDENEIKIRKKKKQKKNKTKINLNEDIDIDIENNKVDDINDPFDYKKLKCIRCKECIEYTLDDILKIEISIVHTYFNNLLDGRFIKTMRENMINNDKMPMTTDCKRREYEIEIEIIDFKKFALSTDRELKKLSLWFSNTCLQIVKLLGYVNDFTKKNNDLPQLCQYQIDKINKNKAQNEIVPLYQNAYYRNHHYHNVIHKQHIDGNDNVKQKKDKPFRV